VDSDLEHLEWLVAARTEIQKSLLALLVFIKKQDSSAQKPSDEHYHVTQMFVATAFSLWRAVFLAETARDWDKANSSLENFLATVVRDNAITYQDDKRYRAWTVTYYLENAKFRLSEVIRSMKQTIPDFKLPKNFWIPWRDGPSLLAQVKSTRTDWDSTHRSFCLLFQILDPSFEYDDPLIKKIAQPKLHP
jgi:hypothetical protein